jgi:hypothetical protein
MRIKIVTAFLTTLAPVVLVCCFAHSLALLGQSASTVRQFAERALAPALGPFLMDRPQEGKGPRKGGPQHHALLGPERDKGLCRAGSHSSMWQADTEPQPNDPLRVRVVPAASRQR